MNRHVGKLKTNYEIMNYDTECGPVLQRKPLGRTSSTTYTIEYHELQASLGASGVAPAGAVIDLPNVASTSAVVHSPAAAPAPAVIEVQVEVIYPPGLAPAGTVIKPPGVAPAGAVIETPGVAPTVIDSSHVAPTGVAIEEVIDSHGLASTCAVIDSCNVAPAVIDSPSVAPAVITVEVEVIDSCGVAPIGAVADSPAVDSCGVAPVGAVAHSPAAALKSAVIDSHSVAPPGEGIESPGLSPAGAVIETHVLKEIPRTAFQVKSWPAYETSLSSSPMGTIYVAGLGTKIQAFDIEGNQKMQIDSYNMIKGMTCHHANGLDTLVIAMGGRIELRDTVFGGLLDTLNIRGFKASMGICQDSQDSILIGGRIAGQWKVLQCIIKDGKITKGNKEIKIEIPWIYYHSLWQLRISYCYGL